jgi:hypothetical protein
MPRFLNAGALSATLTEAGHLVHIRWHGSEILRRIYFAVRDACWGTAQTSISGLTVEEDPNGFTVTFKARHTTESASLRCEASIRGASTGLLTYAIRGEAETTFLRNRIGFCVLHDAWACAGKTFEVIRTDGTSGSGCFPIAVTRRQPLPGTEAMAGLVYAAANRHIARITFEGDVFQMEDQRPWTDASFKCFSTPLELPCPVEVPAGTRIAQSVRLSVAGREVVVDVD